MTQGIKNKVNAITGANDGPGEAYTRHLESPANSLRQGTEASFRQVGIYLAYNQEYKSGAGFPDSSMNGNFTAV